MRNNDDITVRNFGTGLWGVRNVTVRPARFSDDVDIVDADNNRNVITISGDLARRISDAVNGWDFDN
jgi:hypothetical protein